MLMYVFLYLIDFPNYIAAYRNNFEIEYTTEHEWQLKILTALDHNTLQNNKELKIPIIATEKGVIIQGYSILTIHLPESPEFTEQVYTADYPKEGKDPINFNTSPKFKDDVNVTAITLQGKFFLYLLVSIVYKTLSLSLRLISLRYFYKQILFILMF